MSEIAILSDLIEIQNEKEEILFFTTNKKFRVWFIKLKLPDGSSKYYRYKKEPAESAGPSFLPDLGTVGNTLLAIGNAAASSARGAEPNAFDLRREIIQEQVNELAHQGFKVSEKYISLFISNKIKELIFTRKINNR